VDALIIGTIVPKERTTALTAKVIATDTAEIVGAAKADFKTDETVKRLAVQSASTDAAESKPVVKPEAKLDAPAKPTPPAPKPFGELEAKVQSLRLAGGGTSPLDSTYGNLTVTLVLTNTSASKSYGVALAHDFYNTLTVANNRGERFKTFRISGIEFRLNGEPGGPMTSVPPRSAIRVTVEAQAAWTGRPGDFRPYELQGLFLFDEEENGQHPNPKKYNFVTEVK
jgi:hypothetical protein